MVYLIAVDTRQTSIAPSLPVFELSRSTIGELCVNLLLMHAGSEQGYPSSCLDQGKEEVHKRKHTGASLSCFDEHAWSSARLDAFQCYNWVTYYNLLLQLSSSVVITQKADTHFFTWYWPDDLTHPLTTKYLWLQIRKLVRLLTVSYPWCGGVFCS